MAVRRHEARFSADRPGHFCDVEIAVRIDGKPVRGAETARGARIRSGDPCDRRSIRVEDAHAARKIPLDRAVPEGSLTCVPPQLRDIHESIRDDDLRRALNLGDLSNEPALRGEDLNAIAFPIAHQDPPCLSDRDPMRKHELTRPGTRLTPGCEELSGRREMVHPCVSISVRDEKIAVWRDRKVCRPVEGWRAAYDGRDVGSVITTVRWLSRI